MTMTSTPIMSERRISSFTAYDFPAPEVANTTAFAFCKLKRSKRMSELLWRLMPYKIPLSLVTSEEINGYDDAIGDVFMLNVIINSSLHSGNVELNPCSV